MAYARKMGVTFLVGLTALSTLIAGAPHFVCRCPDGQVKLFCVSAPSAATGCCCGNACCRSAGRDVENGSANRPKCCETGKSCCAAQTKGPENGRTIRNLSVQHNGCTRTL